MFSLGLFWRSGRKDRRSASPPSGETGRMQGAAAAGRMKSNGACTEGQTLLLLFVLKEKEG